MINNWKNATTLDEDASQQEALGVAKKSGINHGVILKALRETLLAAKAENTIGAARLELRQAKHSPSKIIAF